MLFLGERCQVNRGNTRKACKIALLMAAGWIKSNLFYFIWPVDKAKQSSIKESLLTVTLMNEIEVGLFLWALNQFFGYDAEGQVNFSIMLATYMI